MIPHVHEGQRARRVGANALHRGTLRPQRAEVVSDPAALLHGQRGLAQMVEDAAEVVGDVAHDEAVEQRHAAVGTSAGQDATGGQEPEIPQSLVELLLPAGRLRFGGSQCPRDPAPGILDGQIDRCAVGCLQPVFRIPDLAGYWRDPLDGRPSHRIDIYIHNITISLASPHCSSNPPSLEARSRPGQGRCLGCAIRRAIGPPRRQRLEPCDYAEQGSGAVTVVARRARDKTPHIVYYREVAMVRLCFARRDAVIGGSQHAVGHDRRVAKHCQAVGDPN